VSILTPSDFSSVTGSPRVLVARNAISAAATRKTLEARRARWKPVSQVEALIGRI
jgi:hypothetical protein